MNLVKVISSEISDSFQRVVKILRYGIDDVQTSMEAMPYGTDSMPIKDMVAVYGKTDEQGKTVIIGYLNKNQIAEIGEHRIFSTDAEGNLQTAIHLKNDGTIEVGGNSDFMVRYSALETAFNELKTDFNSLVSDYNAHMHPTAATGVPSPPTITGSSSGADISNAKIDEIKTS